jgi:hypothetical protein
MMRTRQSGIDPLSGAHRSLLRRETISQSAKPIPRDALNAAVGPFMRQATGEQFVCPLTICSLVAAEKGNRWRDGLILVVDRASWPIGEQRRFGASGNRVRGRHAPKQGGRQHVEALTPADYLTGHHI